ncbi:hypothetical protein [Niabella aquatica]
MRRDLPNEKVDLDLTASEYIKLKESDKKEKLETRRFWIAIVLSIIATVVAIVSLLLQYKTST